MNWSKQSHSRESIIICMNSTQFLFYLFPCYKFVFYQCANNGSLFSIHPKFYPCELFFLLLWHAFLLAILIVSCFFCLDFLYYFFGLNVKNPLHTAALFSQQKKRDFPKIKKCHHRIPNKRKVLLRRTASEAHTHTHRQKKNVLKQKNKHKEIA